MHGHYYEQFVIKCLMKLLTKICKDVLVFQLVTMPREAFNAFVGRAPLGPAGELTALPRASSCIGGGEGR